ncbi:cell wall protein [Streptomyces sp. NPDC056437]|uniref:cell wall protein n=1 Tax=Streptomyces sp. NPDC056437 TaxID=3345816 RepID=UPI0036A8488E
MAWLIAAGHHPRATATTLRVAEDLANRMDYDTGHVRYCMQETAARLGIDKSTVKRHVAILRELGALAWVVHGTKTNIRRALGLGGYAGTATVYAAVIPAVYDHAMGHRIIGTGYEARIVIHQRPVDNSPADKACAPPSLTVVKEVGQVQVDGGFKDTPRKGAVRSTASTPRPQNEKRSNDQGARRTAAQVARGIWITRQVRARVNWTQTERLRRLEYVLRPWTDAGMDADSITAELHSWMLTWRPQRPADYIRTRLIQQDVVTQLADTYEATEAWDEDEAAQPMAASRPSLVASVMSGVRQGLAAYSANQAAQGLDDLTDYDAAADMAAFLGAAT